MIVYAAPMPAGNAVQVVLRPPPGAKNWRLLRRHGAAPAGPTDSNSALVHAGQDLSPIDIEVRDGQTWFYEVFYWVGGQWIAGGSPSEVVVGATYQPTPDHINLIRERLELGLIQYVKQGTLVGRRKDGSPMNRIPVLLGPPVFDETPMPVVTIQLDSQSEAERAIGDAMPTEFMPEDGVWSEGIGWLERMQLRIVGWSLNVDERSVLRHAIKTVLAANMPIFYGAGLDQIGISARHGEDFERFAVPMYQAIIDFTCLLPFGAQWVDESAIHDVDVLATAMDFEDQ